METTTPRVPRKLQPFYVSASTNRWRARYHTLAVSAVDAALNAVLDHCPTGSRAIRVVVRPVRREVRRV
jgi:protein tyrosine phosphatase (PTP) superfamily phosphohydrolase (DUF442 family)